MKTVLKTSLICWGIVLMFVLFLSLIPSNANPVVVAVCAMLVGSGCLMGFGFRLRRIRQEGFELGWFVGRQHGIGLSVLGLAGLASFLFGAAWFLVPQPILEKGAMSMAKVLVVVFWLSLVFAFLGFTLVCFSESVGYLRLKNFKWAAGSFALAVMWLGFATLFCSLFLDVINDNFLPLSATTQNYILGAFAFITAVIGLYTGRYQDLKNLSSEN